MFDPLSHEPGNKARSIVCAKMPSYCMSSQAVIRSVNIAVFQVGGNACGCSRLIIAVCMLFVYMAAMASFVVHLYWGIVTSCREVHCV